MLDFDQDDETKSLLKFLTLEEAERLKKNLLEQDKANCTESLASFLRRAWKHIDPSPIAADGTLMSLQSTLRP